MRFLARCLLAEEVAKSKASKPQMLVLVSVCEKLRPHLVNLMGNTGFHALVSRALAPAAEEVPALRALQFNEHGVLQGPHESKIPIEPDLNAEGSIVFLAQLLSLLVTFIGEDLTLQLLREIWPKLLLSKLGLHAGVSE